MSKLLSHGYVEEKKKSPNDDDASSTVLFMFLNDERLNDSVYD